MVCDFLVGNHNGSVDGVQYFSCPPSYGALVPVDEILCVTASNVSAFSSVTCPPKIFGVFLSLTYPRLRTKNHTSHI